MSFYRNLIVIVVLLFFVGEWVGRYFGLHNYPLYVQSDEFEYIHAPDQNLTIYRNFFRTNSYSMRSLPILPESDTTVVLLIGDSIINGGNTTDHDSLATSILEKRISLLLKRSVRVLNISAGSWGPDNAVAYLQKYGLFHADQIILVVSSHDAFDNITHDHVVGQHPQFPASNYWLAWGKFIERGWQQVETRFLKKNVPSKIHSGNLGISTAKTFNTGFEDLRMIAQNADIPFSIYLHPTQREIRKGDFNAKGQEIIHYCDSSQIHLVQELDLGVKTDFFRDDIHFNNEGQKFLADQLFPLIMEQIQP